jgi:hypothetical protein
MADMIERVARVRANQACPTGWIDRREVWVDDNWESYTHQARQYIEAMREPTKDMQRAGLHTMGIDCDCSQVECWQAMVDAALASGERG